MKISSRRKILAIALALAANSICAEAGEYPTNPIKLIAPFPPGSVQDLRARHIGNLLSPRLRQPIIVENKPGASGSIGSNFVARSKPDGYTLLLCTTSTLAGNAALLPALPYNPEKDFAPISKLVDTAGIVAVSSSSPIKTFQQLVSAAKGNPDGLRYGAGSSFSHILGQLVSRRAGIRLLHVPYKGDSQVITDLLGGHIDIIFTSPLSLMSHVYAGKIRPLAVAATQRLPGLQPVPTLSELGLRDSEMPAWSGLCAPAGTPSSVIAILNRHVVEAMSTPESRREAAQQGYLVAPDTPEEFRAVIKTEIARTKALVQELGIPMEQ